MSYLSFYFSLLLISYASCTILHQFINSTAGFIKCRNVVNAAAEKCLPRHYMDEHPSFKHEEDMCQQPLPSAAAAMSAEMTLEDVRTVATMVRTNRVN